MATSPVAYPVRITTLYLGQVQRLNAIGTMMFVPGIPVVVMLFMKLSFTSRSWAAASPGAAITPTSSTRSFVGSNVAATRTMAPTLDCSTRATTLAALAALAATTDFVLCCCPPPRVHSISECLYRSKVNLPIRTTTPVYLSIAMVIKCFICIARTLLQFIIYYDYI